MSAYKVSALLLAVLAVPAVASESSAIAGVNLATSMSGTAQAEFDQFGVTLEEDFDSNAFSVFLGYQTERNNRFKVSYESRSFALDKSNVTEDASGFRFDWDFVYGEEKVHPFWSIGFGFYTLEDPAILTGSNLEGDDLSGVSFQMAGGVKIDLADNLEASIAFERQAIGWQEIEISYYDETINMTYVHNSLNAGLLMRF
ncbi:outer membrane beta-barrel protein [Thalassolituus sp. LLYu03]|uniref:outer membrane beta-barrel protein n=1 Tax=Thalassolituus sp. LLYu03 TaxID=3421656 RepID=UPI003D2C14C3